MRQLRRDLDSSVAAGRQRALPLQRLRTLLQDERDQQAARQAQELESGESRLASRFSKFPNNCPVFEHLGGESAPCGGDH